MLPLDLYARVRVLLCAIARETAGASRHPAFPAPSFQEEGNEVAKPRASAPRDRGGVDNDRHSNTTNVQGTTAAAAPGRTPTAPRDHIKQCPGYRGACHHCASAIA